MTIYDYLGITPEEYTFKRDYITNPLKKIQRIGGGLEYEKPDINDLKYIYIDLNKPRKVLQEIFYKNIVEYLDKYLPKHKYLNDPKISKEELYDLVYVKKIPKIKIAKMFGLNWSVSIDAWLKKYNLLFKSPKYTEQRFDVEQAKHLYYNQGYSMEEVGKHMNISKSIIIKLFKKYNIYTKDIKQLSSERFRKEHGDFIWELKYNKKKLEKFIKDNKIMTYTHMSNILKISVPVCSKIVKLNKLTHLFKRNRSYSEMQWLDYMGVPNDKEHRQLTIESCLVDGYDPNTKTIYEFYGDFWHGNPNLYNPNKMNVYCGKTMKELYDKTIERENKLKSLGYKLITIWENDWKKIYKDIKKN